MCTNFKYPTATDGTACVGRTMEFPNEIPWQIAVAASDMKGACDSGARRQDMAGEVRSRRHLGVQQPAVVRRWDEHRRAFPRIFSICRTTRPTTTRRATGRTSASSTSSPSSWGPAPRWPRPRRQQPPCNVVDVNPKQIPIPLPLHMILHDKDSCAVVEFHPDGMQDQRQPRSGGDELPLPRLAPHQCVQLPEPQPAAIPRPSPSEATTFAPFAQGQGFRGIPGDGTSPSRFIRVLTNVRFAPAPVDRTDAELQSIRVLHGFDIVPGTIDGARTGRRETPRNSPCGPRCATSPAAGISTTPTQTRSGTRSTSTDHGLLDVTIGPLRHTPGGPTPVTV